VSVCSKLDHLLYHVLHPPQTEVQQSFLSSIFGLALSTTLCSCFAWIHSTRNTSGKASTGGLRPRCNWDLETAMGLVERGGEGTR